MNATIEDQSTKSRRHGFMDGVVAVLASVGLLVSLVVVWAWPRASASEGYPLVWPFVWFAIGASLAALGSCGVMVPAAVLIKRNRTVLRVCYAVFGAVLTVVGVVTCSKWLAVPSLYHGP